MRTQLLFILFAGLFLILFSQTGFALDEMVYIGIDDQLNPVISGKNVVWEDHWSGTHYDIFLYNLENQSLHPIFLDNVNQAYPDIDGNIIVWMDYRNGNADIYGYDIATDQEFAISTHAYNQMLPKVSGHLVVWADQRNGNWDIYGYDLDAREEFEVCTDPNSHQLWPDVSVTDSYAPTIVWQDSRNGNWDIYYFDVDADTESTIVTDLASQIWARIDMPRVVWQDDRDGNWDIYMYTFSSTLSIQCPEISVIEDHAADQTYPVVSGKNVVWQDDRNGNWDIYGGRVGVSNTFPICIDTADQGRPSISDNYVVWQDERNGDSPLIGYDIYGGALGADPRHACSTLLDFEYVHEWKPQEETEISNHYEGVTFSSARPACPDDVVIITSPPGGGTHSGVLALQNKGCLSISGYLQMAFDDPQNKVRFYAGSHCGNYTINAYDAPSGGNLISSQGFSLVCGVGEYGVHRLVELVSDEKNIYRIEIANDNSEGFSVFIDDLEFNFDDTPPVARIDDPNGCECEEGYILINGAAYDEDQAWVDYTLKYQSTDADPDDWTEIFSGHGQVYDDGVLAEWDTSDLPDGKYNLKLEVINECGVVATDATVALVDKKYDTLKIREPDNNEVISRTRNIDGTVVDSHFNFYIVECKAVDSNTWHPIEPWSYGTIAVRTDPYARWNTETVDEKEYDLRVTATDLCGNTAVETIRLQVDNTAPVGTITEPVNCTLIPGGIIPINGTVTDTNLSYWNLSYTGGTVNIWKPIPPARSGSVENDLLGNWDTSGLIPCTYTIRLQVWDKASNRREFTTSVKLGVDLDGDGCVDLNDFAAFASSWLTGCTP